jgi:hypothetical protein
MPFRRWLKESIKEAELLYLYNEAVRGTSDIETIKAGVKTAVLKSVKVEFDREMDDREANRQGEGGKASGFGFL